MLRQTSFWRPTAVRSKFAVNMPVVMLHISEPTMSHGQVSSSFSTRFLVNWMTRPAMSSYSSPESPQMAPSQADFSQNSGMFHSS